MIVSLFPLLSKGFFKSLRLPEDFLAMTGALRIFSAAKLMLFIDNKEYIVLQKSLFNKKKTIR